MDLNFCTICSRETDEGELYCSARCRQQDEAPPQPTSPTNMELGGGPFFPPPSGAEEGSRSRSNSDPSSSEDEDRYVLPGRRNFGFQSAIPKATAGPANTRKLAFQRGALRTAGPSPFKCPPSASAGDEDPERAFLNLITQPLALEHRHRHIDSLEAKERAKFERFAIRSAAAF